MTIDRASRGQSFEKDNDMNLDDMKREAVGGTTAPVKEVSATPPDFEPAPDLGNRLPRTGRVLMECVGLDGAKYRANVLFTVPDTMTYVNIGKMKTMLAPTGITGDAVGASAVEQVCYLTITIDEKSRPSWWAPLTSTDFTPYGKLYEEVTAYAARFQRGDTVKPAGDGASHEDAGDGGREPLPDSGSVGRRVQPPAERSEVLVSNGS